MSFYYEQQNYPPNHLSSASLARFGSWYKDFRVFVNRFTGQVMGNRIWDNTWLGFTLKTTLKQNSTNVLLVFVSLMQVITIKINNSEPSSLKKVDD